MAVKSAQREIKHFYAHHKNLCIAISALFQILTVGIFGLSLLMLNILPVDSPIFWLILIVSFCINLGVNLILMTILLEPVSALTAALSHAAGETSNFPPPNPNARRYDKNGIKQMLELIYSLGAGENEKVKEQIVAKKDPNARILDTALGHSASSIVVFDPKQKITYASAHAPVRANTDGDLLLNLVFDNSDMSLESWLKQCEKESINAEKIWTRVHTNPESETEQKIYDVAASYSRNSESEVTLVLIDRTDKYNPDEQDLDFIAFAAHELRGPITVIRGYLDILQDELGGKIDKDQETLIERLVVSSNRLSTYVTNILNVSRYDRRHYRVELSKESLFHIYDSIADDMESRAKSQHRLLTIDISHDLPPVAADPSSICEVLANLIDNAIKYSNEGGIINLTAKPNGDFIDVSITDHGIGMPDSVVQNLFHKFYRSHRSRESVAGSGIGLYMSKAIIESHGGTISVRSSEDKGSTFTFSLPIYATVEKKLKESADGNNEAVISKNKTWISNHNMYRG
jgi:two-component system phosphate regulon sensor histidine kinase PhoR/two-component system sensor histidine kinase VicK